MGYRMTVARRLADGGVQLPQLRTEGSLAVQIFNLGTGKLFIGDLSVNSNPYDGIPLPEGQYLVRVLSTPSMPFNRVEAQGAVLLEGFWRRVNEERLNWELRPVGVETFQTTARRSLVGFRIRATARSNGNQMMVRNSHIGRSIAIYGAVGNQWALRLRWNAGDPSYRMHLLTPGDYMVVPGGPLPGGLTLQQYSAAIILSGQWSQ